MVERAVVSISQEFIVVLQEEPTEKSRRGWHREEVAKRRRKEREKVRQGRAFGLLKHLTGKQRVFLNGTFPIRARQRSLHSVTRELGYYPGDAYRQHSQGIKRLSRLLKFTQVVKPQTQEGQVETKTLVLHDKTYERLAEVGIFSLRELLKLSPDDLRQLGLSRAFRANIGKKLDEMNLSLRDDKEAQKKELVKWAREEDILKRLPPLWQLIIDLRFPLDDIRQQKTFSELAELLRIGHVNTVRYRMDRALTHLAELKAEMEKE